MYLSNTPSGISLVCLCWEGKREQRHNENNLNVDVVKCCSNPVLLGEVWEDHWGQTGKEAGCVHQGGGWLRVTVVTERVFPTNWPARRAACLWGRSPAGSRWPRPEQTGWAVRSACRHSSLGPTLLPEPSSSTASSRCSSGSWLQLCNPQRKPPKQAPVFNLLFSHEHPADNQQLQLQKRARQRVDVADGEYGLEADRIRRKWI